MLLDLLPTCSLTISVRCVHFIYIYTVCVSMYKRIFIYIYVFKKLCDVFAHVCCAVQTTEQQEHQTGFKCVVVLASALCLWFWKQSVALAVCSLTFYHFWRCAIQSLFTVTSMEKLTS